MAIATGDKVRLFASTRVQGERGSIGRNGSVLTVLEADEAGMRVKNAQGAGRARRLEDARRRGGPHPARLWRGDDDAHCAGLHRHRAYLRAAVRLAGGDRLCRLLFRHAAPARFLPGHQRRRGESRGGAVASPERHPPDPRRGRLGQRGDELRPPADEGAGDRLPRQSRVGPARRGALPAGRHAARSSARAVSPICTGPSRASRRRTR